MSLTPLFDHGESSVVGEGEENISDECQLRVIDTRELTFVAHVARGGMAQISLYMWNRRGYPPKKVAKKSLFRGSIEARYEKSLKKEMGLLARLNHKNIVTTYGIVDTNHDFGLVMEYLPFGSCRYFFGTLQDKASAKLPNLDERLAPLKIQIIGEVIGAMTYLHGLKPKKVLHLDLKSDNVLLDHNLRAKICDFGLSRMTTLTLIRNATTTKLDAIAGTPGYIPPETLRNPNAKPTSKSDVYSFAIFLWELLSDRMPYEDIDCRQINLLKMYVVDQEGRPDENRIPNVYPQELIDMMKQAWSPRPEDRQSFEDLQKELNLLKQHNPEIIRAIHHSTRQTLTLWEWLCAPGIGTERSAIVRNKTYYGSICVREPMRPTMPKTTTPKTHMDTNEKAMIKILSPDDEEILFSPIRPRQETSAAYSATGMLNDGKKCPNAKIVFAIVATLAAFVGGGMLMWMALTNRSACWMLPNPTKGNVSCSQQTETTAETCTFSCEDGYSLRGKSQITCSEGKWNGKPPICLPDCPALHHFDNGQYTCSDGFSVESVCNFTCDKNSELKGDPTVTCMINGKWSKPEPKCECFTCYSGPGCQYSVNWKDVLKVLEPIREYETIDVLYGKTLFSCSVKMHSPLNLWTGYCTGAGTTTTASCGKCPSPYVAAKRAASLLVRYFVSEKEYTPPCDPGDMDHICD